MMTTLLALSALLLAAADDRPDIVLADFEGPGYAGWAATGKAFGPGPAQGGLPGQMAVDGYQGKGLVNSFFEGDGTTGTLTSPEFKIDRKRINFLIGGGRHPDSVFIRLVVDGKAALTATGRNSEYLAWDSWDVSGLAGKPARIEIVDNATGGWGHINVDQIVLSDKAPSTGDERAALLAKAADAVKAAAPRAKADPDRPAYHVLPPAQWMNDPNGPIYYNGYYHMFYQHNPYGDDWGHMHWGHARSKDLARWEHRPIALWPSRSAGEEHVFSGCATLGKDGRPILFYTSIGGRLPEQWAAVPDDEALTSWSKHPANPILTEKLHGDTKVYEWRDPFVFRAAGKTYMVLGGNLNDNKGGESVVNVYRAEDADLTDWKYLGVLFRHPDAAVRNIECPLFFPLGDRWVLIISQGKPVDWFVGDLDPGTMRFTATARGKADLGQFYAPNVLMNDPKGRKLLWGWLDGVPAGKGWRHCLTLPRVLALGKDGTLLQQPAAELEALRKAHRSVPAGELAGTARFDFPAESVELAAELDRGGELKLGDSLPISWDGQTLTVADVKAAVAPPADGGPLRLRVFVDHSIAEVYADDRACVSKVIRRPEGPLVVAGSKGLKKLEAWSLGSGWIGD